MQMTFSYLHFLEKYDIMMATVKSCEGKTMNHLNYEFFDEFKSLDNLCRDIYGKTVDNKLGVTMYLDDMDRNARLGSIKIAGWRLDYNRLKRCRYIRNELAHSRTSFSNDICSREDIDFIRSFKSRIIHQTDPISLLKRSVSNSRSADQSAPSQTPRMVTARHPVGCLGILAVLLLGIACIGGICCGFLI